MKSDLQEKLLSNVDKDDDHSGEELNFKKVFNNEYNNGPEKANSTTSNIAFLLNI